MNRQKQLVDILNRWAYEYYVLDNPTVSDKEYDELYDELCALEKQSGEVYIDSPTRRVGGEPIKGFAKHAHIARLYSLDKAVTHESLRAFLTRVEKTGEKTAFTVEYKFDGLTVCLTYDKGAFVRATTRGNGVEGEDVTAQVLTIKSFPLKIAYKGVLEVRGEVYMPTEVFYSIVEKQEENGEKPFKNPRNAAAGSLRQKNSEITRERRLSVFIFNIQQIDGKDIDTHSGGLDFLASLGFPVTPSYNCFDNIEDVISEIEKIGENRGK